MMTITIRKQQIAERIAQLAQEAGTTPSAWVNEVIEDWIFYKRSGRFVADPARHEARNDDNSVVYTEY